jgi:hypothetical protein
MMQGRFRSAFGTAQSCGDVRDREIREVPKYDCGSLSNRQSEQRLSDRE